MRISNKKAIENVKKFNIENRYRDCGVINTSIDIVLDLAEKYINSKEKINRRIKELKQTSEILKIERQKYEVVEEKKNLLTDEEREYLNNVIKPFRNKVKWIYKIKYDTKKLEYISIITYDEETIRFPCFEAGTMYKGLDTRRPHKLKELGLEE